MKTTKKISAILLAVLFVISMLPFTVSATPTHKLTIKLSKPGYELTVYKVATVDATTGTYNITDANAPDAVKTQLSANTDSTADLFAALESQTSLGYTPVDTMTTTSAAASQEKEFTGLEEGIYYVKFTSVTPNNTYFQNSLVVIDNGDNKNPVLDIVAKQKVNEGEPTINKRIIEGSQEKFSTTTGNLADDLVTFKLTATRTGTTTNKLSEYEIRDVMDAGLSATDVTITSVEYEDGTPITKYTKKPAFTDTNAAGTDTNYTFAIAIGDAILADNEFYTHNQVVVKYTTKLSASAVNKTVYKNHDDLYFKNTSDQVSKVDGNDVEVQTYKPSLTKYQADGTTPLKDAKFELYKSDKTTIIGWGVSDANGNVEFMTSKTGSTKVYLKKGEYYAKEYEAPAGYNLNSSWIQLRENSTEYTYYGEIKNTPVKVPKTGDAGTLAITLTGLGLIIASGAMFVVLMKKRSSK